MKHFDRETKKILAIGLIGIAVGICYVLYMLIYSNPFVFLPVYTGI
jgi:hypothetical protein